MKRIQTGMFHSEAAAILAIQRLKEIGITNEQLSVVTMNSPAAAVIEEKTATEVNEVNEQNGRDDQANRGIFGLFAAPINGHGAGGTGVTGANSGSRVGFPFYVAGAMSHQVEAGDLESTEQMNEYLQSIGFSEDEAETNMSFVEKGYILVVVDNAMLDHDVVNDVLGRSIPPE